MSDSNDGTVLIELSGDEMSAIAFILPPSEAGKAASVIDVKKALREAGVVYGIVNDIRMQAFLDEGATQAADFMVAAGTAPGHGSDAVVHFPWKSEISEEGMGKDEKTKVDLRELDLIKSVAEGEVVAIKTPPTRGEEGVTVTGKRTPGEWGTDAVVKAGPNVTVSEDGTQFRAKIGGMPKVAGGAVSVDPVYIVNGNVDYSTGNIHFAGALEIRGSVMDGFIVRADGNIIISQTIQACEIHSGGDVIVKAGIINRKEGLVSAKGSVYAKFIENSIVEADCDVVADRAIINSSIRSNGSVICMSKEGKIMGGDLMAFNEIRARQLGTENETLTVLRAGFKYDVYLKLTDMEQKLEKTVAELERVTKNLSAAKSAQSDQLADLRNAQLTLNKERMTLQQNIALMRTKVQVNPFAAVKGEDVINPGCQIYIGTSKERITKRLKYATLMSDREGGIALSAYDEATRTTKTINVGTKEKKKTVLIVDDAKFMRNKLRAILENGNFKILGEAEDGKMAIEMYPKLNPDIVTMDITMPNVDGISALKEIRKTKPDAKIVMISALGQKDKVKESIIAGAMDFILKPFVPEKVIEVIERILSK